ncbi:MAG: hypothetical protein ABFC79_01055 [Candidatus Cryosericum sp.]|jgi:hypothetical protein|nr:hypothetical protein [Candidatus Cryosericum sp.]HPS69178.1 hypothetical protein [Candidatus Cryosericum sp.]
MNIDNMIRKATRPVEKHRAVKRRPAKVRHLQKQQKLWMASKVVWRSSEKKRGPAPFLYQLRGRSSCPV